MINKECFTSKWIADKSRELSCPDRNLIEKVIHAFSLLDMLAANGCPFHFKGGSSLMLLLKDQRYRLSIDIDIICPPGTNIEDYLGSYKEYGFIDYKPIERIQRSSHIPKTHSKFFYQVAFLDGIDRRENILLDVLNEDSHYNDVLTLPIENQFIEVEGEKNYVKIPSASDILGDKLTAFAPNTTGIPYVKNGDDAGLDIIKQLYDIARLFEKIDNLEITAKSFRAIAEVELSYRNMENRPELIFDDIRETSLCLATRGMEGKGDFNALQRGIKRIQSYMFNGGYQIYEAIRDAARAAYIATLLQTGNTTIEKYDGNPASIASMEIAPVLTTRLNKLIRTSPEAYYYWAKTSELLKHVTQ